MINKLFDIDKKKAILTGGAGGLGYGMAEGLVESGVEVAIIDLSPNLTEAVEKLNKIGKAHAVIGDISTSEKRKTAFFKALDLLGGELDIMINCAGVQKRHPSEEFPISDWQFVIDINLTASFELCQLAGREMLKKGKGKIINVASMLSYFGGYTVPAYAASKGGVAQFTKALSNEWASKGINVNAIAPGYMDTQMNTALINNPDRNEKILARIPAGRWGTPQDVKGAIIYLSSSASDYINGAIIPVDGGYLGN